MVTKISIITPVLNGEQYISECIESVIKQNYTAVEHIILDGGSTDRTVEIVKKYSELNKHIVFISEKDSGQSNAMNKGIRMASSNIISFLNADDYYEEETFKKVDRFISTKADSTFIFGICRVWDELHNGVSYNNPKSISLKYLLSTRIFPNNPSAYFYDKSLHDQVGYYDESEHFAMDIDFILKIASVAKEVKINKVLGNFRLTPGTKTFYSLSNDKAFVRINELCKRHYDTLGFRDKIEVSIRWKFNQRSYYWHRLKSLVFKRVRV